MNHRREFFKVSIDKAIEVINHEKENPYYNSNDKYSAIEILHRIVSKYGVYIDSTIMSAKIYQEIDRVYFEYTKYNYIADYLKNQVIKRIDLGFIVDDTSMANCIGNIFIEEWFHR